jgi:uncharacterized damage-inducible protein DinB
MKVLVCVLAATIAGSGVAHARQANPLTAGAARSYGIIAKYLAASAEKMPEEHYSFKPTPDVRSFGQLVGHVADAQFMICAAAAGEKPPTSGVEKSMTTKADLQKALAESTAYCDKVFAGMTDAAGAATIKFFTGETPKLSVLEFNTHHDFEHYGNMVTYMRIKGLVPPSSAK